VVYITAFQDGVPSQTLSTLVESSGWWGHDLGGLRTADYQSLFTYAGGDQVLLVIEGVGDGRAMLMTTVDELRGAALVATLGYWVVEQFNAGLNLWALSNIPATGYTASTLATSINEQGGSVTKLFRWYAGGWQGYRVDIPLNDFTIELGQGYFILSTAPSIWGMPANP